MLPNSTTEAPTVIARRPISREAANIVAKLRAEAQTHAELVAAFDPFQTYGVSK